MKGSMMILAAVMIWGVGMAFQSAAMEFVGPFTFNTARFFIGGIAAAIPALLTRKKNRHTASKGIFKAAFLCGAALFLTITLIQFALIYTTVGKVSFITSLYVIIVPVAGIFFGRKASKRIWCGASLAIAGMYFLSLSGDAGINIGDVLVFLCAFTAAAQILLIDRYAPVYDIAILTGLHFFMVAAMSLVPALIFENPSLAGLRAGMWHVLYTGVLSSGVAYMLQMEAQKTTEPAVASLLFSLEAVIAAFAGWLWLQEVLSIRELLGCALVLAAVVVARTRGKKQEA